MWPFELPNNWRLEADGTLTHQSVTEQMKASLAYLADVYATGVFNPDFATLNRNSYNDEMASGISGGYTHNLASGYDLVGAQLRQVIPSAVVYPMTPVEAAGYQIQTYNRPGFNGKTQIRGDYADDHEKAWALIEVIHYWMDPATETFVNFGFEGVHHTVNEDGSRTQTEQGTADIQWIRAWSPRHYLEFVDAPYVTAEHREQIKEDTHRLQAFAVDDPTWGLYPELGGDDPTAALEEFTDNTFEAIVRGDMPIDAFDSFVTDWYSRGGQILVDAISEIYNEVHNR
jgi:putative aldouronate transport system substrate-binding protein